MSDDRDPKTGQFIKGKIGGPGRPKGAKNKFQEQFWRDLQALWEAEGANALRKVLETDASTFVRVAAGLLPKEMENKVEVTGGRWLTEAEWLALSISQDPNSETTTSDPSVGLASWPTDGQARQ
jgi:hypothetical protein